MGSPAIAIISPGDMGHVVGGVLNQRGFKTLTALEGRSELSRLRAERAMISDVGQLKNLISEANILLSINSNIFFASSCFPDAFKASALK